MNSESTRAELLRRRIRDVQDLATELGVRARVTLHADGEVPAAIGPVEHEHTYESRCGDSISDCESFVVLDHESAERTRIVLIVVRGTRPAKEAV